MDRKLEKKNWPPRKIAAVAGSLLFVSLVLYMAVFADSSRRLNVQTERVTISEVHEGEFDDFIPVNGTVAPYSTYFLDAPEGGVIAKRILESGAIVKEGDIILQLTNSSLQMQVMSQEANLYDQLNNIRNSRITIDNNTLSMRGRLAEVEYQLEVLMPQYERMKQLFDKNLVSEQEYEDIAGKYRYNQNRLAIEKASYRQDSLLYTNQMNQLAESERRLWRSLDMVGGILDNLTLRAPMSGQLTMPDLQIGQSINKGEKLGQIDVLDAYKVRVRIDEHYINRVTTGLTGFVDVAGTSYELELTKVFPTVTSGEFEVDMEFIGEPPSGLRRGQTMRIRLRLGQPSRSLLLARGGFHQKTGGNWVYIVNDAGTEAVKQSVRIGRQNPQFFEVLEGLNPGDRVITSSYDTYGDADKLILQ